jgi:hypothetical protein
MLGKYIAARNVDCFASARVWCFNMSVEIIATSYLCRSLFQSAHANVPRTVTVRFPDLTGAVVTASLG